MEFKCCKDENEIFIRLNRLRGLLALVVLVAIACQKTRVLCSHRQRQRGMNHVY